MFLLMIIILQAILGHPVQCTHVDKKEKLSAE